MANAAECRCILQAACFRGKGGKAAVMKEADVNQYKALLMARRAAIAGKSRQREEICIVQSSEEI